MAYHDKQQERIGDEGVDSKHGNHDSATVNTIEK
jgi:hypothetical protein